MCIENVFVVVSSNKKVGGVYSSKTKAYKRAEYLQEISNESWNIVGCTEIDTDLKDKHSVSTESYDRGYLQGYSDCSMSHNRGFIDKLSTK